MDDQSLDAQLRISAFAALDQMMIGKSTLIDAELSRGFQGFLVRLKTT
jgi:hypothetical protein